VEHLDEVGGIPHIFGQLPTCGFCGVVKTRPLDQVEEAGAFSVPIDLTIENPLDFVFARVVYLQRGRRFNCSVRDRAGVSQLEE